MPFPATLRSSGTNSRYGGHEMCGYTQAGGGFRSHHDPRPASKTHTKHNSTDLATKHTRIEFEKPTPDDQIVDRLPQTSRPSTLIHPLPHTTHTSLPFNAPIFPPSNLFASQIPNSRR